MYELVQAGEKTWYIDGLTKIGLYETKDNGVYCIDSGPTSDAGKRILKIIESKGWRLDGIINTHSNADHIGGNGYLQNATGCQIISSEVENFHIQHPEMEPAVLFGGFPNNGLHTRFLYAEDSTPTGSVEDWLPEGLTYFPLKGHYFDMIGIKTSDDVYFLADSIFGESTLTRVHIGYIYNVHEFLNTLDMIEGFSGRLFLASHAKAVEDVRPLAQANRTKIYEIADNIMDICSGGGCIFEEVQKKLFDHYNVKLDFNQYALIGGSIRNYISWLYDEGKLTCSFADNRLTWITASADTLAKEPVLSADRTQ